MLAFDALSSVPPYGEGMLSSASAGKLEVVCTLLDCGASQAAANRNGFTGLDCASTLPVLRLLRPHRTASQAQA